jgi:hypothetical protein
MFSENRETTHSQRSSFDNSGGVMPVQQDVITTSSMSYNTTNNQQQQHRLHQQQPSLDIISQINMANFTLQKCIGEVIANELIISRLRDMFFINSNSFN